MDEPIRIISDLHLGHTASLAREIAQIEPLYDGARTVIFNGDTVEMRSERCRARAERILREVEAFCARQPAETHFINGNHDPIISKLNHLEIDDGLVLVTHGDILFHEERPVQPLHGLAYSEDRLLRELDRAELDQLERILSTRKRVNDQVDLTDFSIPSGNWGRFSTFMKQTWPPKRLVRTVSSWRNTPMHAINLVRLYRPEARCVIVGHTHFPGIWHRHGYVVINTGSFLPMLGRFAVDYEDGRVTVRKVIMRRGRFHLSRHVSRLRLNGAAFVN